MLSACGFPMRRPVRSLLLLAVAAGCPALQARILHPQDGSRHHDEPAEPQEDYAQMLREGFEMIDDGDLKSALRAIQRATIRAPRAKLAELEQLTIRFRDEPLADLLAQLRFDVALAEHNGRTFKLRFLTPLETEAMSALLRRNQHRRLNAVHLGKTVAQWAAERNTYKKLHSGAKRLAADARLAAAFIGERLRRDPLLKQNVERRRELVALRAELGRFVAHVSKMPGFTSLESAPAANDPAAREVARLRAAVAPPASRPASQPASQPIIKNFPTLRDVLRERKPPIKEDKP